ncbi:hypothetical protein IDG68_14460, partial [Staphylococcus sp. EG-SA-21]|nr:hypothetical protein [Staphylococcus sp. EG-SA-21]
MLLLYRIFLQLIVLTAVGLLPIATAGINIEAMMIGALTSSFRNSNEYPEIVFVGNHLSSTYTKELVDYLADKDFSVNV